MQRRKYISDVVMATLLSYLTVYFIAVVSIEKGDGFFIILFVTFDQVI